MNNTDELQALADDLDAKGFGCRAIIVKSAITALQSQATAATDAELSEDRALDQVAELQAKVDAMEGVIRLQDEETSIKGEVIGNLQAKVDNVQEGYDHYCKQATDRWHEIKSLQAKVAELTNQLKQQDYDYSRHCPNLTSEDSDD